MKPRLARSLALPFLALALFPVPGASTGTPGEPPAFLARTALIGASITEGFGLDLELEAPAGLELFVEAALGGRHGAIASFSSGMFFSDPQRIGAKQIDQATAIEATLVIALDFLFWYGYGVGSDEARAGRFEEGLKQLERLDCPLVVADLPDMRAALKGSSPLFGGGPLISAAQIPPREVLARLNVRLREWADGRPNTIVLPLADFVERLRQDEELKVARQTIPAGTSAALLQSDLLHTTVEGTAVVTLLALDALRAARADFEAEAFAGTTEQVISGVRERTEAERERRRERDRKREERRRAREEKAPPVPEGGGMLRLQAAR